MNKKICVLGISIILILLSGCVTDEREKFHSNGIYHEPYGMDDLYGEKEVPGVWWERIPRDPVEGDAVTIVAAADNSIADMDVWIEWSINDIRMDKKSFKHTANLDVNGSVKRKLEADIGSFMSGDKISYDIFAGDLENGEKKRRIGAFSFTASGWVTVQPLYAAKSDENEAVITASAGDLAIEVKLAFDDDDICKINAGPVTKNSKLFKKRIAEDLNIFSKDKQRNLLIPKDSFDLVMFNSGRESFRLEKGGIHVLTDGENIYKFRLTPKAFPEDNCYGFGMRYDELDQAGKVVDIYTVNWYTQQKEQSYTPVPYYFVPDKYGMFIDSTFYSRFDMDPEKTGSYIIDVNTGADTNLSVPIYLFSGSNEKISEQYSLIAGKAVLPPVWAFAPWISANEWNRQSEIMEQMEKSNSLEIPTGVIVIEAWSDEETFYIFNDAKHGLLEGASSPAYEDFRFSGKWPDPKGMVSTLKDNGIRTLLWQIPVLKYSAEGSAQSARDQWYAQDNDYILKKTDGTVYRMPSGTWFGNSLLIDFTNPEAGKWFLDKRRYLLEDIGIDGFKTDGGEFIWGRDIVSYDGRRGDELRNAFPDLYAQAYFDYSRDISKDAVTFSRSGGSGMQSHPLSWVGDQRSDLDAYKSAVKAVLSASMSGIPFTAWDVAGFSGDVPTGLLYQRSTAQAAFSAVMQVHSETSGDPVPSQARTPWNMAERKGSDECLETYKYYANVRMNLMPYIYTEARYSSMTGQPLMRAMAYEFPEDMTARKYEYQYMFGRSILVAPVMSDIRETEQVEIYLPEGVWYDLFDGTKYESGVHSISCEADEIPVFVKSGSALPINSDGSQNLGVYVGNDPCVYGKITYLLYPGEGEYSWYDHINDMEIKVTNNNTGTKIIKKYADMYNGG